MPTDTPTDASRGVQTPAQAARLLGVHANSVRSWCDEYADVLSESARSRPRLLLPSDVAVLQLVHSLRAEGLSRSAVLERLKQTPVADRTAPYIDAAPVPTETPTAPAVAPPVALDVSAALVDMAALVDTRTTATQEAIARVDARLQRLETQRTLWIGVAVGLVAGVVLGVIVAAVLLLRV